MELDCVDVGNHEAILHWAPLPCAGYDPYAKVLNPLTREILAEVSQMSTIGRQYRLHRDRRSSRSTASNDPNQRFFRKP